MNRKDKARIAYQVIREVAPRIYDFGMAVLGVLERHEASKVERKEAESKDMPRPQVATDNEGIRDVFMVGQTVLMRRGTAWVARKILGITVLRNNVDCPYCGVRLLGEPRFWFKDHGNVPIDEVMAEEDFDPKRKEASK